LTLAKFQQVKPVVAGRGANTLAPNSQVTPKRLASGRRTGNSVIYISNDAVQDCYTAQQQLNKPPSKKPMRLLGSPSHVVLHFVPGNHFFSNHSDSCIALEAWHVHLPYYKRQASSFACFMIAREVIYDSFMKSSSSEAARKDGEVPGI